MLTPRATLRLLIHRLDVHVDDVMLRVSSIQLKDIGAIRRCARF